jgi:tRNA (guanine-N7-)-methyltransferase
METTPSPQDLLHALTPSSEVLEQKQIEGTLDWRAVFDGVEAPVELEVGCGNGRFLRRAAAERPDHLFFGIERNAKYAGLARDRMVKYAIGNARIARADATHLLGRAVPAASLDVVHVYFTDPWPKKRHAKRRIFQTPFLETLHRVMKPGARLFVRVDLLWYFEEILGRFERSPHFRVLANGTEADTRKDTLETTGFEQKALRKWGVVFYIEAENLGD